MATVAGIRLARLMQERPTSQVNVGRSVISYRDGGI